MAPGQTGTAHICVEGQCIDAPLGLGGIYPMTIPKASRASAQVTAEFTAADGTVLATFERSGVAFTRLAPNGEKCGPVCWIATFQWNPTTKQFV